MKRGIDLGDKKFSPWGRKRAGKRYGRGGQSMCETPKTEASDQYKGTTKSFHTSTFRSCRDREEEESSPPRFHMVAQTSMPDGESGRKEGGRERGQVVSKSSLSETVGRDRGGDGGNGGKRGHATPGKTLQPLRRQNSS